MEQAFDAGFRACGLCKDGVSDADAAGAVLGFIIAAVHAAAAGGEASERILLDGLRKVRDADGPF